MNEQYQDTEDLDGLFSGYDPHAAAYDRSSWSYESVVAESASGTGTTPICRYLYWRLRWRRPPAGFRQGTAVQAASARRG